MNARVSSLKFFGCKQYTAELARGEIDKYCTKLAEKARVKALTE